MRLRLAIPGWKWAILGPILYLGRALLTFHCMSLDIILKVFQVNGYLLRSTEDKNGLFLKKKFHGDVKVWPRLQM